MSRIARTLIVAAFAAAGLAGCAPLAGLLAPASSASDYVATRVCGVDLDGKTKEARLRIELTVTHPLPPAALVEVQFENPSDPNTPLVTGRRATGDEQTMAFVSPPVKGIRVKSYAVLVRIYSSPGKERLLSTHLQSCQSPLDQRDMGPQFQ